MIIFLSILALLSLAGGLLYLFWNYALEAIEEDNYEGDDA